MLCLGQGSMACKVSRMACRGEGDKAGHNQVTAGWRVATAWAVFCAFNDCGEDRNPCRYSRCVVGTAAFLQRELATAGGKGIVLTGLSVVALVLVASVVGALVLVVECVAAGPLTKGISVGPRSLSN